MTDRKLGLAGSVGPGPLLSFAQPFLGVDYISWGHDGASVLLALESRVQWNLGSG